MSNITVFAAGRSVRGRNRVEDTARAFAAALEATPHQPLDVESLDVSLAPHIRAAMSQNGRQDLVVVHDGRQHRTDLVKLKEKLASLRDSHVFLTFLVTAETSSSYDGDLVDVLHQLSYPHKKNVNLFVISEENFEKILDAVLDYLGE